ncbi:MAG: alpha-D-ribose 1-methylphosphonate 5-triphosphate diphosphatase [Alphaproteobacteria bacterium]
MTDMILTNARIVTGDRIVDGTLIVRYGQIGEIAEGKSSAAGAVDMEGDLLIPGLVELHTDSLEGHMTPRPGTDWPATAAVIAHDSQIASAGITTVFDAIAIGALSQTSARIRRLTEMVDALQTAVDAKLLRVDHKLHLRCEVSFPNLPDLLEPLIDHRLVRLISVMDHTPGQRQFVKEEKYREYYQGKFGLTDSAMEAFIREQKAKQVAHGAGNRCYVVNQAQERGISLASHDDATHEHVAEAVSDGMSIAEFPTTVDAAKASRSHGLSVMMGGPNVVRGGSHSGNVSALELAAHGVLDIVSSDYVPFSLLHAAFVLSDKVENISLPQAIAMISKTPAASVGLTDRGEIAIGKRADIVRVHPSPHHPIVRAVWREGNRIA